MSDSRTSTGGGEEKASSTHFIFTSKVFALPGGYFSITRDTSEPVLNVHLGEVWGKIPFRTLRESFDIQDGSEDGRLLTIVEKGLKFVKEIRPGDSIPREILDGSASWRVDEKHLQIARGRLAVQLMSWITGKEVTLTERYQLEQIVDDPQTKQRTQEAFVKLAKQFGLPEERKQEIVDKVDALARELSYIEALRDRYGMVQKIMAKLTQAKRIFKGENHLQSEIARMQQLAKTPSAFFDDIFMQIDGQTAEIMALLKTYEASVAFIRRMRDELHISLMLWDEIISAWNEHEVDKGPETEAMLKRTYQFLAQHFLVAKVWSRSA
ncbi:MAG: hypothetical protein RLY86_743 [Pseudomonadota bacterium]|jgi:hypothetical protein